MFLDILAYLIIGSVIIFGFLPLIGSSASDDCDGYREHLVIGIMFVSSLIIVGLAIASVIWAFVRVF